MSNIIYYADYANPLEERDIEGMIQRFNSHGYSFQKAVFVLTYGETFIGSVSEPTADHVYIGCVSPNKTLSDVIMRGIEQAGLIMHGDKEHIDAIVQAFNVAKKSIEFKELK